MKNISSSYVRKKSCLVRRKCFSAVPLEGLVLLLHKLQISLFSCASFTSDLGISEMIIVSKTFCEDIFLNLLMNMNPFHQIRTSADRETFICIKYAALFGLVTWFPSGGGGKVSTSHADFRWIGLLVSKMGSSTPLASGIQKANSSE